MKKFSIIILFVAIALGSFAKGKVATEQVKGQVIEVINGVDQPVAMAFIYVDNTIYTAYTDDNGVFSLEVPKGKHELKVSFKGYNGEAKTINTKKDDQVTFKLNQTNLASK